MKVVQGILGISIFLLTIIRCNAQEYPDQHQMIVGGDTLFDRIESSSQVLYNSEKNVIELETGALEGYFILESQSFSENFNVGLPSWNGHAPANENSSFKVQMRFEMSYGWSSWVTVGFWDKDIWSSYGSTTFTGGKVYIDEVKLDSYVKKYQFRVDFKRLSESYESANMKQLSFFVSDSRTTSSVNLTEIENDKPEAFFIPTSFVYQYAVDDVIGPDICSPTSTSMILKSFDYVVDPYQFALRTKDPYWGIFGVWPRSVQHASEYGLRSFVGRYRTWSEASDVLKKGGRIAMSIGQPLYTGHLVMLAGFDDNGNPILHDPAKSNGYSIVYNKRSLSEAWFNKGGVAYTFFGIDETNAIETVIPNTSISLNVFPNPIVGSSKISVTVSENQRLSIKLYNMQAQCIDIILSEDDLSVGKYDFDFPENLKQGIYIIKIESDKGNISTKIVK